MQVVLSNKSFNQEGAQVVAAALAASKAQLTEADLSDIIAGQEVSNKILLKMIWSEAKQQARAYVPDAFEQGSSGADHEQKRSNSKAHVLNISAARQCSNQRLGRFAIRTLKGPQVSFKRRCNVDVVTIADRRTCKRLMAILEDKRICLCKAHVPFLCLAGERGAPCVGDHHWGFGWQQAAVPEFERQRAWREGSSSS